MDLRARRPTVRAGSTGGRLSRRGPSAAVGGPPVLTHRRGDPLFGDRSAHDPSPPRRRTAWAVEPKVATSARTSTPPACTPSSTPSPAPAPTPWPVTLRQSSSSPTAPSTAPTSPRTRRWARPRRPSRRTNCVCQKRACWSCAPMGSSNPRCRTTNRRPTTPACSLCTPAAPPPRMSPPSTSRTIPGRRVKPGNTFGSNSTHGGSMISYSLQNCW